MVAQRPVKKTSSRLMNGVLRVQCRRDGTRDPAEICLLTKKLVFTCEDVGRATGEGREDIERVELDWEEPLA